ncbi:phosphoinositide phospholipase C 2-like protein, partial [Tanacetum coccineum]
WWDLGWSPLGSYADWLSWFKNIRMGSILKSILEEGKYLGTLRRNFNVEVADIKPSGPSCQVVLDDMKALLSHYFIYTSHNTYLTGDQFTNDSSVRPIIKALQKGIRGIQPDLWLTSTNTHIKVCHGRLDATVDAILAGA